MRRRFRFRSSGSTRAGGFSLVEVLAALGVFSLVTLGIVPLLGAALRGTSLARTETVAQNTARQMMERIQGLKWYTSWDAKAAKVDILDLFFPSTTGSGYETVASSPGYPPLLINGASAGIYTTSCPAANTPACGAIDVPDGYTMTVKAAFVKAKTGTTPQAYEIVTPPSGYAHDTATADAPPAQLLDVNVIIEWTANSRPQTFQLRSIIGEHKYVAPGAVTTTASPSPSTAAAGGTTKVRATATNDYIYQVQTGFTSSAAETGCATPPCTSELDAVIGNAVSTIQAGDTVSADSTVATAKTRVVRSYVSPQVPPTTPPADLVSFNGVTHTVHAPPTAPLAATCLPSPPTCTAQTTTNHPDFGSFVAGQSGTRTTGLTANVSNGNPTTSAAWTYRSTACSASTPEQWFYNPLADMTATGYLRLDTTTPSKHVFHATDSGCASNQSYMKGSTSALATALTPAATRAVTATTTQDMSQLNVLRVNYGSSTSVKPAALRFSDWTASVTCSAKPGGGTATGSWTGVMVYSWDDTNGSNNNGVPSNLIGMQVNINSSGNDTIIGRHGGASAPVTTVTTPNALAWLQAQNPLMYDGNAPANDIYLFNDPPSKRGYIDNAVEDKTITTSVSADGRNASASINGAIRIDTNQLHATIPETAFNVSVGKLSCQATDNR